MKTPEVIDNFIGPYFFLSNFYASPILYQNVLYPTVEHVYQAMKTKDKKRRYEISLLKTPGEAKKAGRSVELRKDWEDVKNKVMLRFVRSKFEIESLRIKLLETGDSKLIEGNWWGDTYWGICKGVGKNTLGKILMKVREELR